MNPRRSKNRLAIGVACGFLALGAAALAAPHHPDGGPGSGPQFGPGGPPSLAGHMLHRVGFGIWRLDLNAGQRESIHMIFEETRQEMETLREATRETRTALHDILTAEILDTEALAAAARIEGELEAERLIIAGTAAHRILAELDESQRAELEALRAEHRERRSERAGPGSRRG